MSSNSINNSDYTILDWDTNLFGYKVARLTTDTLSKPSFENLLKTIKEEEVKVMYVMISPDNASLKEVVEESGGILVDKKLTYTKQLTDSHFAKNLEIHSYLYKELTPSLNLLALTSGFYSRFHLDPHFTSREFEKLYREWIKESLRGKIADDVLVFNKEQEDIGLLTFSYKDTIGKIGLMSVDVRYTGQSIGTQLMEYAEAELYKKRVRTLEVVTQAENKGACIFYEKKGFVKKSGELVYHIWL